LPPGSRTSPNGAHLLDRLRRQVELTADPGLAALLAELRGYPVHIASFPTSALPQPNLARPKPSRSDGPQPEETAADRAIAAVAVPLRLRTAHGTLSFLSTTMVFGTPVDVTLSELAIEAFFPADHGTVEVLRALDQNLPTASR